MHRNKGKTLAQCLHDRTAYAMNPEKTQERELISAYECNPQTAENEFLLSKREYGILSASPPCYFSHGLNCYLFLPFGGWKNRKKRVINIIGYCVDSALPSPL